MSAGSQNLKAQDIIDNTHHLYKVAHPHREGGKTRLTMLDFGRGWNASGDTGAGIVGNGLEHRLYELTG